MPTPEEFDKLRKAAQSKKEDEVCYYDGCNYKIKSAILYEIHLALKHPEGNKKVK